jgi:predicted nucleic acid-binding protein
MTLYLDASAFVKRYAPFEVHHEHCLATMDSHDDWITSRLTAVEAARGIVRASGGDAALLAAFDLDASEIYYIDVDFGVAALARVIALETGVKSLDALHIASAKQFPDGELEFLTYDDRQADAARMLGLRLAR